jgi:hypothetical protein
MIVGSVRGFIFFCENVLFKLLRCDAGYIPLIDTPLSMRRIRCPGKSDIRTNGENMLRETATNIQQIIETLLAHGIEVAGPTWSDWKLVYRVNGHAFSRGKIRVLSTKQFVTS